MKQLFGRALRGIACLATLVAGSLFTACDKEPFKPSNEIENKLHEDPHKVVYTLTEYRLKDAEHFLYPDIEEFEPVGNTQTLVWQMQSNGTWAFEGAAKEFVVKTAKDDPKAIYKLSIEHFNPKGVNMNHQFIDNGQDKIHQYLFSIYKDNLVVRKPAEIPYQYLYADKHAKTGKLLGEDNPVGMEGFFKFRQDLGLRPITAVLLHAYGSKYLNGVPSPYYAQNPKITGDKDISVRLLFRALGNTEVDKGDNTPQNPSDNTGNKPEDTTVADNGEALNTTEVHKVSIFVGEGHFHGSNFHYLQGPQNLTHKNFGMEQEITATWEEGKWVLSGTVNQFVFYAGKKYQGANFPAPSYGFWIKYYDKAGKLINEQFVEEGKYQTFFRPTKLQSMTGKGKSDYKPEEVFTYHYKDSKPWDKSVYKQGATDISATNPIGLKGFLHTDKSNLKFTLNIELWATPKGKKVGDIFSLATQPSAHILGTGKCLLRIPIPAYITLDKAKMDILTPFDTDEFEDEISDDLNAEEQAIVKALMKLLGINFQELQRELYLRLSGKGATETSGVGYWF